MIKINGKLVDRNQFPDGTLRVLAPELEEDCKGITFTWLYESDAELFMLQCLVDKFEGFPQVLILPYIPHARMDRVKNPEDVFTLKTFCKVINAMNFATVAVLDPHSDVSLALLDRVKTISMDGWVEGAVEKAGINTDDLIYFYPDAGAAKRYDSGRPHTYGIKKRNWETGKIESLEIADADMVKGKTVMIVDDICSYGGTFSRAAAALKAAGAEKVYLFITHCEPNIFKGTVFTDGNIEAVYTTNSFLRPWQVPEEFNERVLMIDAF